MHQMVGGGSFITSVSYLYERASTASGGHLFPSPALIPEPLKSEPLWVWNPAPFWVNRWPSVRGSAESNHGFWSGSIHKRHAADPDSILRRRFMGVIDPPPPTRQVTWHAPNQMSARRLIRSRRHWRGAVDCQTSWHNVALITGWWHAGWLPWQLRGIQIPLLSSPLYSLWFSLVLLPSWVEGRSL